jgi:glutathionylspermidine synthase
MEEEKLKYKDFLKIFERQKDYNDSKGKEMEPAQTIEEEIEEEEVMACAEEAENESDQITKNFCRVCGERGFIDIFSPVSDRFLTIPRSRFIKMQDVPISDMIKEIGGEEVSEIL